MEIDFDEGVASLRLRDVPVTDAHDLLNNLTNGQGFPSQGVPPIAPVPATVSFDIEWSGITGATIDWSAESANFAFQSESPNPARNLYSVIGHEQNGVFFHLEADD